MAARAGAELADLEFVQFHPTALLAEGRDGGARLPLLTEALRGAGATLLDETGDRFMLGSTLKPNWRPATWWPERLLSACTLAKKCVLTFDPP